MGPGDKISAVNITVASLLTSVRTPGNQTASKLKISSHVPLKNVTTPPLPQQKPMPAPLTGKHLANVTNPTGSNRHSHHGHKDSRSYGHGLNHTQHSKTHGNTSATNPKDSKKGSNTTTPASAYNFTTKGPNPLKAAHKDLANSSTEHGKDLGARPKVRTNSTTSFPHISLSESKVRNETTGDNGSRSGAPDSEQPKSRSRRLIHGRPVTSSTPPTYVAAIFENGDVVCTGSVLDPYHVLTAAHCVDNLYDCDTKKWKDISNITVGVGSTNLTEMTKIEVTKIVVPQAYVDDYCGVELDYDDFEVLDVNSTEKIVTNSNNVESTTASPSTDNSNKTVQRLTAHELLKSTKEDDAYDPKVKDDLAVLRLNEPVPCHVRPVKLLSKAKLDKLAQHAPRYWKTAKMYGFGANERGAYPDELMEGYVKLTREAMLGRVIFTHPNNRTDRVNAWSADSGGPLVVLRYANGQEYLAGVVHGTGGGGEAEDGSAEGPVYTIITALKGRNRKHVEKHTEVKAKNKIGACSGPEPKSSSAPTTSAKPKQSPKTMSNPHGKLTANPNHQPAKNPWFRASRGKKN